MLSRRTIVVFLAILVTILLVATDTTTRLFEITSQLEQSDSQDHQKKEDSVGQSLAAEKEDKRKTINSQKGRKA